MLSGHDCPSIALLTDLYELTMAAAYVENRLHAPASFELFVRSLPPERSYLLAAGLDLVKVRQFLSPCHLSHPPDGPWRLAAPSRFQRDWIRERYADTLARVLGGEVEVVTI